MLGSTVLEVAVGLTFCYATVALIVSTLQEIIATMLRLRAGCLLEGIKSMLGDPQFTSLARAVYGHVLVNPHEANARSRPSYIEPANFAVALIDAIRTMPADFAQLGRDIDALPNTRVKRALQGLYLRAQGDMALFERSVALWFDTAMVRVSAAYKRRAMAISLVLSLLLAILFNIDSIHLFRSLWQHPALAAHISGAPGTLDAQAIEALRRLPIGWQNFPPALNEGFVLNVAGWLLTASTALFGAPFWFELTKKTVQLRGARP
ncbi:hypothetical protein KY495_09715 [Massilia sp. PAMC28688]|uniref:hypothetical protein n=1 Tax=Massilia sp. PAMC28688 TaxID=2861283 RepID=UPI001C62B545|nr:hypothetical protein [Massilia sp. PAMC28688]QYF95397.1 hypothetical protein KY495_09715 [Massilia sp. PAMC28688]